MSVDGQTEAGTQPECEHDWRADPAGFVYTSYPPARRIVCAKCGAKSFQHSKARVAPSRDPKDWEKA